MLYEIIVHSNLKKKIEIVIIVYIKYHPSYRKLIWKTPVTRRIQKDNAVFSYMSTNSQYVYTLYVCMCSCNLVW